MKKFIPLFFGLMLPLAGAMANDFTTEAIEFCKSKGGSYSMGSMVEEGDKYCRQVTCKKTNNADGKYEIPEGAPGPEANVEATKRVCIAKSIVDGSFDTNGSGNSAGSASGSQSGSASGAQSGSASGSQSGSASGAQSGSASGAQSGSGSGSGDAYVCEELEGEGRIQPGGLCYSECKPRRSFLGILGPKKEGFERKSCVECLLKYPGVYRVKREYLPRDSNGKVIGDRSVGLGAGVTVKTGVIICKDANGRQVSINGSVCPTGTTIISGGSVGTGAAGSGSGTIIISGGAVGSAAGGAGGGIQRPAFCDSSKKKDLEACAEWMRVNQPFLCSSSGNMALCTGGASVDIMSRYDRSNCVNCGPGGAPRQSTLSGIAEIVGAIAPPLAQFGSAYVGAKAYQRGQEAWAGAAAVGFEQCQLSQNNYLQYLQANELPGMTPAQQAAMNCNGFSLGGYAGLQNPGLGGWYGAGYTPGMIGGMMGPYGGYNPYGMGGYVGGVAGGIGMAGGMMAGGYPGGYAGGYPGGMAGGLVNGISIAGGVAGGYPGAMAGGYVAGGYAGGYPGGMAGGYVQGGYAGGYPGGYVAGGMAGGYPGGYAGGMAGGLVNGISIAGGVAGGGYPGGYAGGMAGGYAGGYAGGMAGGYAGGYAGGMAGGAYSNVGSNYDMMMQQQGTSYQMGALGGMGGGYGAGAFGAGGYPMNAGIGINATFNGGFYGF